MKWKSFLIIFLLTPVLSLAQSDNDFDIDSLFEDDGEVFEPVDPDEPELVLETEEESASSEDDSDEYELDFAEEEGPLEEDFNESSEEIETTELDDEPETKSLDEEVESLETPEEDEPELADTFKSTVKKGRGTYIYHPNQEKGLFRIDKDLAYYYKVPKSKEYGAASLKGGVMNFENFVDDQTNIRFDEIYDSETATSVIGEWEWRPFKKFKTLSVKLSSGLTFARGQGVFFNNTSLQAQEEYTLFYFPNNVGLTYRFKFRYKQLFVPFVTGGLDYHLALEVREDFNRTRYSGIAAAHFGGGLAINMGWFERLADLELDSEYGINNTYLTVEVRQIESFYNDRDISATMIVAGFLVEY